mmetsp:Transcript_20983/g.80961  ORF Transcript_20983/g.80961 Transcript_20983/m.80961 type:complete len:109 (-) Transcript_20983:5617-5943(-)
MLGQGGLPMLAHQFHLKQLLQLDETRAHAIIDIVRVVGDFIGKVAELRLQAGLAAKKKAGCNAPRLGGIDQFRVTARAMLEDALSGFEAKIETIERGVALFQPIHHTQ